MARHLQYFGGVRITSNTANLLQEAASHGAIVVEHVDPLITEIRDPVSNECAYVYSDEAGLWSMPYPTREMAHDALHTYMLHL
ncbi:hypothetical protein [Salmonella phage PKM.Hi.22.6]|uniref:Uncharacterized protein n=1 Tax=phage PKM.Lu.22.1 TaxID=3049197 RepID=A0AAF0KYD9_9CAUD|nr:hypothetical protein [phage PKM.Lu.22.1]WKV17158.1 hypothetical protein [Salmonella phage PKM.Hi.22.6]